MTPKQLMAVCVSPGLALLPDRMDSPEARRMLVAIAHQESYVSGTYRRLQIRGPARSRYQIERGGALRGVMRHTATKAYLECAIGLLDFRWDEAELWEALPYSEALAAVVARLNLWWLPRALPSDDMWLPDVEGWEQYMETWRPGRPHPERWDAAWAAGEEAIA